jgi:hypothetical protein
LPIASLTPITYENVHGSLMSLFGRDGGAVLTPFGPINDRNGLPGQPWDTLGTSRLVIVAYNIHSYNIYVHNILALMYVLV